MEVLIRGANGNPILVSGFKKFTEKEEAFFKQKSIILLPQVLAFHEILSQMPVFEDVRLTPTMKKYNRRERCVQIRDLHWAGVSYLFDEMGHGMDYMKFRLRIKRYLKEIRIRRRGKNGCFVLYCVEDVEKLMKKVNFLADHRITSIFRRRAKPKKEKVNVKPSRTRRRILRKTA